MSDNENFQDEAYLETENKLKRVIIAHLNLDKTPDELDPLEENFLDAFGFDSYDALKLLIIVEKEFALEIDDDDLDASLFRTIRSLAAYVYRLQAG